MNSNFHSKADYKLPMGKRLRTYRVLNHYTQENMAEILDISLKHYSEVERGITGLSIEKLIFLSNHFEYILLNCFFLYFRLKLLDKNFLMMNFLNYLIFE